MTHQSCAYNPVESVVVYQAFVTLLIPDCKIIWYYMAQDQVKPDSGEVVLDDVEVAVKFRVWSLVLTNYPDYPH